MSPTQPSSLVPDTPTTPASSVRSSISSTTPRSPITPATSTASAPGADNSSAEDRRAVEKALPLHAPSPVTPTPHPRRRASTAIPGDVSTVARAAVQVRSDGVIDLTGSPAIPSASMSTPRAASLSLNELFARTFANTGPVGAGSIRPSPRSGALAPTSTASSRSSSRAASVVPIPATASAGRSASVAPKAESTTISLQGGSSDEVCIVSVIKAESTEPSLALPTTPMPSGTVSARVSRASMPPPSALAAERAGTPVNPTALSVTRPTATSATPAATRANTPAIATATSTAPDRNARRAITPSPRTTPGPRRSATPASRRTPTPARTPSRPPTATAARSPISARTPTPAPAIAVDAVRRRANSALPYTRQQRRHASVPAASHAGWAGLGATLDTFGGSHRRVGRNGRGEEVERGGERDGDVVMVDVGAATTVAVGDGDVRDNVAASASVATTCSSTDGTNRVAAATAANSTAPATPTPRTRVRTTARPTTNISSSSEDSESDTSVDIDGFVVTRATAGSAGACSSRGQRRGRASGVEPPLQPRPRPRASASASGSNADTDCQPTIFRAKIKHEFSSDRYTNSKDSIVETLTEPTSERVDRMLTEGEKVVRRHFPAVKSGRGSTRN